MNIMQIREGQFGKIGENMVAFELSKRGWIVFLPPFEDKSKKCLKEGCLSEEYKVIFRTIQVKSTHLVDEGRNLGFNFKYQDLLDNDRHFFVIYNRDIVENKERHFYWILSVQDFKDLKNTDTVAFKIYQNDRCHFPPSKLRQFLYDEEKNL